jgi:hypothetical protein
MKRIPLLLFVAACGDNHAAPDAPGRPDSYLNDAGADASIDAPLHMGTVHATARYNRLTEAGGVMSNADATLLKIIDSAGTTIDAVEESPGMLRYDNVAVGPYWICDTANVNRKVCAQTTVPNLDLDRAIAGRHDAVLGTAGAQLTLTITPATAAAGPYEFLDVRALNTDFFAYPSPPAVTGALVTVQSFQNKGLLVSGDVLRATQLVNKTSGAEKYLAAVRSGTVNNVTMTQGTNTAAAISMTDLPQTNAASFTLKRSVWDALDGSPGPTVTFRGCEVDGYVESPPYEFAPWVFQYPPPDASVTDVSVSMTYGNPWPSTYKHTFEAVFAYELNVMAPGAATSSPAYLFSSAYRPISELTGDIVPKLSRPKALKINGLDAAVAQTGVTATPTLSWSAPAVGTPTRYTVFVYRLIKTGGDATVAVVSGAMSTTATSINLPAGFVNAGEGLMFTVRAQAIPGYDIGKPFARPLRYELADTISAVHQL